MSQTIGKYTYCQGQLTVHFGGKDDRGANLVVGKYCSFGLGVQIFLGGNHRIDWCTTYPLQMIKPFVDNVDHPVSKGDVVIGNDVWIGMNSMIMSGVTIGDGAVIGAGSVVTKNIGPYNIFAGNPARFKRLRFELPKCLDLMRLRWWDWSEEMMLEARSLLLSNDISGLVDFYNEKIEMKEMCS